MLLKMFVKTLVFTDESGDASVKCQFFYYGFCETFKCILSQRLHLAYSMALRFSSLGISVFNKKLEYSVQQ